MIFALVGNQNSGKTTLFNQLTGSHQRVGNFPGVTVEQKIGCLKKFKDSQIVDLPGIYSLRPYSNEEIITRDFIINQKPDAIINIIDATNIERNLYLTLQLIVMKIPTIIALNMMDEVRNNGGTIDLVKMSNILGVPVIPISASKNEGIDDLITKAYEIAKNKIIPKYVDLCEQGAVHRCIHSVAHLIEDHAESLDISPRFAATKLVENDEDMIARLNLGKNELDTIEHAVQEMEKEVNLDRNAAIADMRYKFIEKTCDETVKRSKESKELKRSIKIDKILTNKYFAIPMFALIMLIVFYLSFEVIGAILSDLLAKAVDALSNVVNNGLVSYGINDVVRSLVIDGIFSGVGSVLSFLPIIITLFFFLSILEDTGYMARVAFIMDKLLRKIGLSGKSIVPMLIGFGCTVPAIMATRTLSSERDRKMTVLLTPFMSCSAKIPIYALFTAAFFTKYKALVMLGLYLFGIIVGIIVALVLKGTKYKGNPIPFVMELPNYRLPSPKSVFLLMWQKAFDFLKKAFTVIFVATIIIWFLQTFDLKFNIATSSGSDSMLSSIGKLIAPIFIPLGIGDWRMVTALITGFMAKEAVVSTFGVLLNTSVANLSVAMGSLFTPITAISFLIFTLLYTPCVAAVSAIKREFKSGFFATVIVIFQCGIAWLLSAIFYQTASLFTKGSSFNAGSIVVLAIIIALFVTAVIYIGVQKKKGKCIGCSGCPDKSQCASCKSNTKK